MSDNAKLELLKRIGMRIMSTCITCEHGKFRVSSVWGVCSKHSYVCSKLCPTHIVFCCNDYSVTKGDVVDLGVYAEILPQMQLEVRGEKGD